MATAAFGSSLTYTPGGGGSLTQSFNVNATYVALSSGSIDVGVGTAVSNVDIPFGGVNVEAQGIVIKNNTGIDIGIRLNGAPVLSAPVVATDALYRLAPGGVLTSFAPKAAGGGKLTSAAFVVTKIVAAGPPSEAGTVEYIVLGT